MQAIRHRGNMMQINATLLETTAVKPLVSSCLFPRSALFAVPKPSCAADAPRTAQLANKPCNNLHGTPALLSAPGATGSARMVGGWLQHDDDNEGNSSMLPLRSLMLSFLHHQNAWLAATRRAPLATQVSGAMHRYKRKFFGRMGDVNIAIESHARRGGFSHG